MPSAEEEIWRYSRIGDLDLARFAPQPDRAEMDVPAPVELVVDGELDDVDDPDVFDELVEAFGSRAVLGIPAGATITETIVIDHEIAADGAAVLSRLVIEAGADSDVTVIERFRSPDEITALVVPTLELRVGPHRTKVAGQRRIRAVEALSADHPHDRGRLQLRVLTQQPPIRVCHRSSITTSAADACRVAGGLPLRNQPDTVAG